jgi:aminoglycoside phosphotransferase (APT) family kinase protein
MHDDQLTIDLPTVSALIAEQFPQWRDLPIRPADSTGTVNAIFRVGDRLAARFPLQPKDLATARRWLEADAAAARELLGATRFATPEPIALGEPGPGYPMPWSVQTWLPGTIASVNDPAGSAEFAEDLAEFILGVRALDTKGRTFAGPGRGGVLTSQDTWVEHCFAKSEELLDVPLLRRMWAEMRQLPRGDDPDVMSHKDLIPGNVLVADGRLAGVLDVGDLGPADPALDLIGAWHLLDDGPRRVVRTRIGCSDLEWERGRAWAFVQALGAHWYYVESNPPMSRMGATTIDRVVTDWR